ncbi:hypothetical protein JCM8208_003878 [Rhodotorula glutinis]
MHQRLETDDSLLEVDGLANFAASLRDSSSSRGGAEGAGGSHEGGWDSGRRGRGSKDEQDEPHSQPAHYNPRHLPFSSSSPSSPSSPSLCAAPRPFASPTIRTNTDSRGARLGTHPSAEPSPPRPAWFEPPPSCARPLLKREPPPHVLDGPHDSLRSPTTYGHPPPFSPPSALPYPPPPPFVSPAYADPHAVAYPFDDYVDYRTDVRGDLGTSSWSARTDHVDREDDAVSEKGYTSLSGPSAGEWHAPAGTHLHGVGFDDSHAHGAAQPAKKSAAAVERRREQLARKFGGSGSRPAATSAREGGARTEEEEMTGVDAGGRLVTVGRRKRIFLRCAQAACALLVGVCAIAAAFTHPVESADHPAPAPKGSAPHWALIVLPFLSLALSTYLFAIHPCLHRRRRAGVGPAHGLGGAAPGALGVYPLLQPQQPPHSKRSWSGGGGGARGGGGPGPGGGMSVNLVVDPRFLPGFDGVDEARRAYEDVERRERQQKKRRRKRRRRLEERRRVAAENGATLSPSSSSSSLSSLTSDDSDPWTASRSTGGPRNSTSSNPRRALLSHLSHEAAWRAARSLAKRVAATDFACCIAWGGLSVWAIGWAGKCAPGEGEGFCNLFNSAEACAVLASVAFASSFALGCFDLSRSKLSPRLRQQRLVGSV